MNNNNNNDNNSTDINQTKDHKKILNINIGVLGHVDTGKTSICKALSTTLSTAALDKNPQSQARGITLDLGFSSFSVKGNNPLLPLELSYNTGERLNKYDEILFTLVDCPGHGSLIKTIIGGASIIDKVILVIDVTKGIQTQTAECLVIAEIMCENIIIVFNKMDLLKEEERASKVSALEKGLTKKIFSNSNFKKFSFVSIAANPTLSKESPSASETEIATKPDVQPLIDMLIKTAAEPTRSRLEASKLPFYFSVDHCFNIKGLGTILTGTVLNGSVRVNDLVELPNLKLEKKVKSMQMFHQPIEIASCGDRVGICVTQLDSSLVERGILCQPGTVGTFSAVIAAVDKIRFFKGQPLNKSKFHVSIGHATSMATAYFFGFPILESSNNNNNDNNNDNNNNNNSRNNNNETPVSAGPFLSNLTSDLKFDMNKEYLAHEELFPLSAQHPSGSQFAFLVFEKAIQCQSKSILIGSHLDSDIHSSSCRIAFQGRLLQGFEVNDPEECLKLKVFKRKEKEGAIDRIVDNRNIIVRDMFSKNTDLSPYINKYVYLAQENSNKKFRGIIESSFGKSGKVKVCFQEDLELSANDKAKVILCFKKFMKFDLHLLVLNGSGSSVALDEKIKKLTLAGSTKVILQD